MAVPFRAGLATGWQKMHPEHLQWEPGWPVNCTGLIAVAPRKRCSASTAGAWLAYRTDCTGPISIAHMEMAADLSKQQMGVQ